MLQIRVVTISQCELSEDQLCHLEIAEKSVENVSHFKYLATTVKNQNLI
jgi:hypothetical protein